MNSRCWAAGSHRHLTALDHVEAVRIRLEDFNLMLQRFPEVRAGLEAVARDRIAENRQRFHRFKMFQWTRSWPRD